jgi:hypothetical protein
MFEQNGCLRRFACFAVLARTFGTLEEQGQVTERERTVTLTL